MRLWHQALIPLLPRQQLLGQHRECCALRGKGWEVKHETVDYVFSYSYSRLFKYHGLVMDEMGNREYNVGKEWTDIKYRGKSCKAATAKMCSDKNEKYGETVYTEHDEIYLRECIENLREKGVDVSEMEKLLKKEDEGNVTYRLYKLRENRVQKYGFKSYESIINEYGRVDKKQYKKVYTGVLQAKGTFEALEKVWYIFNKEPPKDCYIRSLSIGDVVQIEVKGMYGYFYSDVIGWKKINFN